MMIIQCVSVCVYKIQAIGESILYSGIIWIMLERFSFLRQVERFRQDEFSME